MREARQVRGMLGVFPSLFTLLILTFGCMPHGIDSTVAARLEPEETVQETTDQKAVPFFFFRSGGALTIEGSEGD